MPGKLKLYAMTAAAKAKSFFSRDEGEVNVVAIVVLIGIAVLLAIIFRDNIEKLLKTLFTQVNDNASKAVG